MARARAWGVCDVSRKAGRQIRHRLHCNNLLCVKATGHSQLIVVQCFADSLSDRDQRQPDGNQQTARLWRSSRGGERARGVLVCFGCPPSYLSRSLFVQQTAMCCCFDKLCKSALIITSQSSLFRVSGEGCPLPRGSTSNCVCPSVQTAGPWCGSCSAKTATCDWLRRAPQSQPHCWTGWSIKKRLRADFKLLREFDSRTIDALLPRASRAFGLIVGWRWVINRRCSKLIIIAEQLFIAMHAACQWMCGVHICCCL